MSIPGTVQITGPLAPTSLTDTYPTHEAEYGAGGMRSVADHAARNAITTARREQGMLVVTNNDELTWMLLASPWDGTDADWIQFSTLPGAAYLPIAPIAFAFGDAPGAIYTAPVMQVLTYCRVLVTTSFDGTSPALRIGTLAGAETVMPASSSDMRMTYDYERLLDLPLNQGDQVLISITPGSGASQGAGLIFLNALPI